MPKGTSTKGKGKGLKKKLGPFPTYVWLLIGVIALVGYYYYRKRQSEAASIAPGSQNQNVIPSQVFVPAQTAGTTDGSTASGSSGDSGVSASPSTFPYDYVTNSDFQSGLSNLSDQVGSDIASITFPQPNVNITVPTQPSASSTTTHPTTSTTKTKAAAKRAAVNAAPKKIRYYTYKRNVPIKAGQTLHYAKNKGYYAA